MKFCNSFSLALILVLCVLSHAVATQCRRPRPPTQETCIRPSVVKNLNLELYSGRWVQIFLSGRARMATRFECATANLTAIGDILQIRNCVSGASGRALCTEGDAIRGPAEPKARRTVAFVPGDALPYNVAAVLGNARYGYYGVAIYSCVLADGVPEDGFFVFARSLYAKEYVLRRLQRKLECAGFEFGEFVESRQPARCRYFDGPDGFDLVSGEEFETLTSEVGTGMMDDMPQMTGEPMDEEAAVASAEVDPEEDTAPLASKQPDGTRAAGASIEIE